MAATSRGRFAAECRQDLDLQLLLMAGQVCQEHGEWTMTACVDCGLQIKHVGENVWIDNTQGDCCYVTDETHRPQEKLDVLSGDT